MAEHKINLTGQVFNGLEVIDYDAETSKKNNSAYYICKCQNCGQKHSYKKTSLLSHKASCKCMGLRFATASITKLEKGREEAEKYIGTKNGESVIDCYNEQASKESGQTTVDLICSSCGKRYSAVLAFVKTGRYKVCSECSKKGLGTKQYKDLTGQTFGLYEVKSFNRTENGRSWWNCLRIDTLEECVVNSDTLYQSRRAVAYKYIRNGDVDRLTKKIPFTFIDKDNK